MSPFERRQGLISLFSLLDIVCDEMQRLGYIFLFRRTSHYSFHEC